MTKSPAFFALLLMVSTHLLAFATTAEEVYTAIHDARRDAAQEAYRAIHDARRDAAADTGPIWYCGGFAIFVTAFTTGDIIPIPPTSRFLGKSYEYIRVYNREYEKAANNSRWSKSIIGGIVGPVVIGGCLAILNSSR